VRVFLARHGETEWNAERRLQGRTDTRLSPRGEAQALALAGLLAVEPITAIYTSTLRRTRDTAQPLALQLGLEPQARPEMDEMSYGVLEGHQPDDPDVAIQALFAARKADRMGFRAPGGETYAEVRARVAPFGAELRARHAGEAIVVIGHRASNRVLWSVLMERSLAECFALKHKHEQVLEIRLGPVPECIDHRYAIAAPEARES